MLNPDGVINGNHRCSLAGQDLNRQWACPNASLHPSIYHAKNLILYLRSLGKKPLVFCDYHGHSRKKNVFVYGNNPKWSWLKDDRSIPHHDEFYLLPEILEEAAAGFCLHYCSFQIQQGKESSARVNIWREIGVARAYTLEASYGGFDRGVYSGFQVGTRELMEMGEKMIESLVLMREYMDCNRAPSKKFESSNGDSDDSGMA
uniref:Cytosolic carboxypeptidase 1 n=1 Tax=Romanomermis culicivorax TaxID=13658 RepID=A0A915I720_ROMCU